MKLFRSAAVAAFLCGGTAWAQDDDIVVLPLVEDIAPSVGYGDNAPDVIGIHFGDSAADAIAKLKATYPGMEITENRVQPGVGDNRGNAVRFEYLAGVHVSSDGNPHESVDVRFTTPASGGRVFQISRTIRYEGDLQGSMEELRSSIATKYGTPMLVELYPHQNRDEITYTWEKRAMEPFGEQNVQTRGFGARRPSGVDVCLNTAESSIYGHPEFGDALYSFARQGQREGNPGWDACIGGIKFTIFYGSNDKTVSLVKVTATDYDRSWRDALMTDALLAKLLEEKSSAVSGEGAPAL